MAKRKKPKAAPDSDDGSLLPARRRWAMEDRPAYSSTDLMVGLAADLKKVTGFDTLTPSSDSAKILIGVPLETFSQRLLYQSTVLPMGRVIHVFGPTESMKSVYSFDVIRLHARMRDGCAAYHETEGRDQGILRDSVFDYDEIIKKVQVVTCPTMNLWQTSNTRLVQFLEENSRDIPGNCPFVICSVVDSFAGAATQKTVDKVKTDGFANPGFSEEAKSFNIYAKVFFDMMAPWPMTWLTTNHQKFSTDKFGHLIGRTPGGQATGFHTSYGFAMRKMRDYKGVDEAGREVMITVAKNSLGDARTVLFVNLFWYKDDTGRQHTYWDWYDSSIRYLKTLPGIKDSKEGWRKKVAAVVDLEFEAKSERVTSKKLGCKKVSFRDAGILLENNPEVREGLDEAFGIQQGRAFVPGISYEKQRKMAQQGVPYDDVLAMCPYDDYFETFASEIPRHDSEALVESADEPEVIPQGEAEGE